MYFMNMVLPKNDCGHFTKVVLHIKLSRQCNILTFNWVKFLLLINILKKDMLENFTNSIKFLLYIFQTYYLENLKYYWNMSLKWWFKVFWISKDSSTSKNCISKWDIIALEGTLHYKYGIKIMENVSESLFIIKSKHKL